MGFRGTLPSDGLNARRDRRIVVWLLWGFAIFASAQTKNSDRVATQSDAGVPVISVQSKLVVVRVMVVNKKTWHNGPSDALQRCELATEATLFRLPATEPYIPTDCEGLFIRGLTAKDFHILVDGVEQRIQSVTSESDALRRVRDNQGLHDEFSQTPAGKWGTTDDRVPRYFLADYDLAARNRYDLSFVPTRFDSTGCHEIKVKVDRRNSMVFARDQYCASESPSDILNGTEFGKQLERDLATGQPGEIPLALQAAVFESDKGRDRLRIALDFPLDLLHRQWSQHWTLDATIGLLGVVYRSDGALALRFSDFACCASYQTGAAEIGWGSMTIDRFADLIKQVGMPSSFVPMTLNRIEKGNLPTRYETQLDLPPGEYDLRIILSDGEKFGRAESHLNIESYGGKSLALSSVMLCKRFRDAHVAAVEVAAANIAPQYVPMVSNGIQVTPVGDTDFKAGEPLIPYFEIYARKADGIPTAQIQAHLRIVDAKTGAITKEFPSVDVATYMVLGSTTIPIAREVPVVGLQKGQYRLEVQATDSAGRSTPWKTAKFSIGGEK